MPRLFRATLLVLLALALGTGGGAAAQSITVKSGATVAVNNGAALDLQGGTMDLGGTGATARLREQNNGRVTGGTLTATRSLNAPSGVDVAGLGTEISSSEDLGDVTVERRHTVQTSADGGESIARYYDVSVTGTNNSLEATLTHHYADPELNGRPESDLNLFASDNGGSTWSKEGADSRDTGSNTVTTTGIDALGGERWILGTGLVQTTIYVDESATGANDGTSWDDAYVHLQDALDQANANPSRTYEVRVAEGTYVPDEDDIANDGVNDGSESSDHTADSASESFTIAKNNVQLFGGYPSGGGTRDWKTNQTILSGDLNGDDIDPDNDDIIENADPDDDGTAENLDDPNAHHVLFLDGTTGGAITSSTVIDGVTVTAGQANGSGSDRDGGGLYCDGTDSSNECSPTINEVAFSANQSDRFGGAVFNNGSSGGVSSPTIVNTTFSGNATSRNGGAVYNRGNEGVSSPTIVNTTLVNNTATENGGAMYNDAFDGTAEPVIVNATLTGNTTTDFDGGALYNNGFNGTSSPTIKNTILWGNSAGDQGDEMYNFQASPTLRYSILESGSIFDDNSSTTTSNTINAAPRFEYPPLPAGDDGVFGTDDDGLHVTPNSPAIDAGNSTALPKDITDLDDDSDTSEPIPIDLSGANREQNGTVDIGAYEGGRDQPRTIYVDASATGANDGTSWTDADTRLQDPNSIESGALDYATGNDEIRIAEGVYKPAGENASFTITGVQDGLTVKGGYDGSGSRDPQGFPTVLSGDIDNDDNKTSDGVTKTASGIDGPNSHHVLVFDGGNKIGADVAPNITNSTVLDGVIVTGGQADGTNDFGGGLFCDGKGVDNECSPLIQNVRFRGNTASFGGAIFNEGTNGISSPQIANSSFVSNKASSRGGAILNDGNSNGDSNPIITGTKFVKNTSAVDGGAIYNNANGGTSTPAIREAIFAENEATSDGGALFNNGTSGGSSNPFIQNAVFVNNDAGGDGGALFSLVGTSGTSSPEIINTVFAKNTADSDGGAIAHVTTGGTIRPSIVNATFSSNTADRGGAMYNDGSTAEPEIVNSILWGNSASSGDEIYNDAASPTLTHTIIEGGVSGSGISENNSSNTTDGGNTFDQNPQFNGFPTVAGDDGQLATMDDNLGLEPGSPALDAGTNAPFTSDGVAQAVTTDITGASRWQDLDANGTATVNMGAYESVLPRSPSLSVGTFASITGAVAEYGLNPNGGETRLQIRLAPASSPEQDTLIFDRTFTGAVTQPVSATARRLQSGTTYEIEAEASNTAGTFTAGPTAFTTPPAPDLAVDGGSQTVTVRLKKAGPSDFGATTSQLYVRRGGDSGYQNLSLASTETGTFEASVPDSLITTEGVDYYAFFGNGTEQVRLPARDESAAQRAPLHLPVSFDELSPPNGVSFKEETYRMISVPAAGNPKNTLTERFGEYDPVQWRALRWDASEGGYREFPDLNTKELGPGRGFWLVSRRGTRPTVSDGRTVDASTPTTVPLTAGWNQIGNPFGFAVSWDSVRAASGLSAAAIDGPFRYRQGEFQQTDTLTPWKGYFLFTETADTLVVPTRGAVEKTKTETGPLLAKSFATSSTGATDTRAKGGKGKQPYTLTVEAVSEATRATTHLGLRSEAKEGRDAYDLAQPPSVRDEVRLSTPETIDGRTVPHIGSAKPLEQSGNGGGQSWQLELSAPEDERRSVRVQLREDGTLPSGGNAYLLDLKREQRVAEGAELRLDAGETRTLKAIVGTKGYVEKQSTGINLTKLETTLRGSYPNPFEERATIEYVLSETQAVTIEIYDILGRRIRTLVDGKKDPGVHEVQWHGKNRYGTPMGSGVYFYRMRTEDKTETKKMVLVR